jgi:LysR family transcriptional activator of nhaA
MTDIRPGRMEWLNYHHLLHFWMVAREGGLVPAGRILNLSHPTLSAQIRALEESLGEQLFQRTGRRLALTDVGRTVFRYADEIFTLGRELVDTVKERAPGRALRLDVGVVDVVPKMMVRRLLQPALALEEPVRLVCHESSYEKLLGELALHALDLVIADSPVPAGHPERAFSHLLGETGVTFFGARTLAERIAPRFPESLDGAPLLLPIEGAPLRRALDHWFDRHRVEPRVVAEFADSALLKVFGADGLGIFAAPTAVENEVSAQYGVRAVGRTKQVRERFYAVSVERRLRNPAAVAITEAARAHVFVPDAAADDGDRPRP